MHLQLKKINVCTVGSYEIQPVIFLKKNMSKISKQFFSGWLQIKITTDKSASLYRSILDRKTGRDKIAFILLIKLFKSFDLIQQVTYYEDTERSFSLRKYKINKMKTRQEI